MVATAPRLAGFPDHDVIVVMTDIRRTLVAVAGINKLVTVDTVQYQGEWWLVPKWNSNPATGKQQPARMIAMAPLNPMASTFAGHS